MDHATHSASLDASVNVVAHRPVSPRTLDAWAAHWRRLEIPIESETAEQLRQLRDHQDKVDANALGEIISADPLMTLRLLVHAAEHRSARMVTETETVIAALVMMGISPFFNAFPDSLTVEDGLGDVPDALAGLRAVLRRSHRAANFALAFALHRGDHDAAALHLAGLLHDFAEVLLWCHAPDDALAIARRLAGDATLRSAPVQRETIGVTLADLQQTLMQLWHLPELLVRLSDEHHAAHPQVRCVLLAARLARHTAHGWDNAAIPDDVADVADLLNLSPAAALALLKDIDG